MGFFSDLWDGATSICKDIVNTTIEVFKEVKEFVNEVKDLAVEVLKKVCSVAVNVCKFLGLIQTKNPEELGDKVVQANEAGITLEKYDFKEYKKRVEEFKVDKNKSSQISDKEKYLAAGIFCEAALYDRFDFGLGKMVPILKEHPEFFMDGSKLGNILLTCEKKDFDFSNVTNYFAKDSVVTGNLRDKTEGIIIEAEKLTNKDDSDDELIEKYKVMSNY